MFIGTQKVKPTAFVDDLINPNRTVSDIIESGETVENIDAVKYLGDIFNSKGNNNHLIESSVKTGKQKIGVIQAFCKEIALGSYEI